MHAHISIYRLIPISVSTYICVTLYYCAMMCELDLGPLLDGYIDT
jgi:hypothetical protein